ncbi:MAG: PAS domain S-box protein, partial [Thermodesulfobacteriota bacterium]
MENTKILIVEDEIIVAEDLAGQLRRLGHEVVGVAVEGEEAIALARKSSPDLVLMDIRLKGVMDGVEAANAIRREQDVPIVYLTAHSDPPTVDRAKFTEPSGYIVKPFEERELAAQIELSLHKHRAERRVREQREWLRVTLRSIGDAVVTSDGEERVTFVNPVAEALSGWTADDASGLPIAEVFRIVDEQTGEPMETPVAQVLREARVIPLANHTALVTKDGRTVPIEDSAAPILDADGRVIGAVLVFHDVTEQRRAREAIRKSEARLRMALQAAGGGVWDWDLVRDRIWLSSEMYEMWNVPPGMSMNLKNSLRQIHKADRERVCRTLEASLESGEDFVCDFRLRNAGNGERWMASHGRPVRDESGQAIRISGISKEITRRKRRERALAESREWYQTLFDSGNDAIFIHAVAPDGTPGNIVQANATARALSGFSEAELAARTPSDLFAREFPIPEFGESEWDRPGRSGKSPANFETLLKTRDGPAVPVEIGLRHFRVGGKIYGISVARDIRERLANQAERERLIAAVEQAGDGIVITDADGAIQYANPAFEALGGYAREEILGQNPAFLLNDNPEDPARFEEMWRTVSSGRRWTGRRANRRKDGTIYTAECAISPVRDRSGKIQHFVWISRDVSREELLEKRMAESQRMEAIGNLAGGIAHDFNNILFPIMGMAELLLEDLPQGSRLRDSVEEILRAGKRGAELVKRILAVGRRTEPQKLPIRVQQAVKEALKLARSTIPANIEIEGDIRSDCDPVMADPTQLHQIAMNLIANAYHAAEETDGQIGVRLSEVHIQGDHPDRPDIPPGRYACLLVSDTGRGISPEIRHRIFDPYFTTKAQGKGTGLGLAMVYGIVKDHGGEITVESEPGRGTVFRVYLPALEIDDEKTGEDASGEAARGRERILLVDDEPAIARLERTMLERLGYRVTAFQESQEALAAFRRAPDQFDLALTDMAMPRMSGERLSRELLAVRPDIPIVVLTGYSARLDPDAAAKLGIRGFLRKPVSRAELAN